MNILEEREESSDENTSFYNNNNYNNSQENISILDTGYIPSSSQETTDYSLSFTSNNTNNSNISLPITENDNSNSHISKKLKIIRGGPKFDEVWSYFNKGEEAKDGHYSATCFNCERTWARGKPAKLKAHLANQCIQCPLNIQKYWQEKLAAEKNKYTRSQKTTISQTSLQQQSITNHFRSNKELPPVLSEQIDHSLLKAWVMAGIPFEVIENPFIVDFIHDLNPGYVPPSRITLSNRLLDQEISRVNLKIEKELEVSDNLTLSKILFNLNLI
jgi:hypothetical protein